MDEKRLLEILEDDARTSIVELAAMCGSTEGEVEKTLEKLKKNKVIKGSRAVIDWKKLDSAKASAVIQVKVVPQQKTGFDQICTLIAKDRRVTDVFIMSGKYDLMITLRADTIDEISEFVTEKLAPMKSVMGTYTHVILKEFKRDGILLNESKKKRLPIS